MKKIILILLLLTLILGCKKNPFYGVDGEDKNAPNIIVDYPTTDQTLTGTFNLLGRASDTGGDNTVLKVEVLPVGSTTWTTWRLANGTTTWSITIDSLSVWGAINEAKTIMIRATDTDYKQNVGVISITYNINNTNVERVGSISDVNDTTKYDGTSEADYYHQITETGTMRFTWKHESAGIAGYDVIIYNTTDNLSDIFTKAVPAQNDTVNFSGSEINPGTGNEGNITSGVSNISLSRDASDNLYFQVDGVNAKTYYIGVKGYDASGVRGPSKYSSPQVIDLVRPIINTGSINLKANNQGDNFYHSTGVLSFTWDKTAGVTENDTGIRYFRIYITGSTTKTIEVAGDASTHTETFSDGTYNAQIKTVDMAGNESTTSFSISNFTVDTNQPLQVAAISDNGGGDDDRDNADGSRVVNFNWSETANAVGYIVNVYETNTSTSDSYTVASNAGALSNGTNTGITSVTMTTAAGTSTFQFTPPADNKKYYIQVKAYDSANNQSPSWRTSDTISVDITNPVAGSVTDPGTYVTSTNVTYSWSGFSDAGIGLDHYEVYSSDDGTNWSSAQNVGSATTVTTNGYDAETYGDGETVYLRVCAIDKVGNSSCATSDGIIVNVAVNDVGAISDNGGGDNDRDNADGTRVVSFTWTELTDATGHDIQVYETTQSKSDSYNALKNAGALGNGTNTGITSVTLSTGGGNTTFQFTAPADGRKYYIKVKAYDAAGNNSTNWSTSDTISVDITNPAAGSVTDPGTYSVVTSVTFSWSGYSDAGIGLDHFEIYSSDDGTNWSTAQNVGLGTTITTNGYDSETFADGETVYLRVCAIDKVGNSNCADSNGVTINTGVSNVGAISDNGGGDDDRDNSDGTRIVQFIWSELTDATGHNIQVYETTQSQSDSYSALKNAGAQSDGANTGITSVSLTTGGGNTTFQFTAPVDGRKYYVKVKAYDAASNVSSDWTTSDTITVDITNPTDGAASVSDPGDYSGTTSVQFNWSGFTDPGIGIDHYEVQSCDGVGGTGDCSAGGNWSSSQVISGTTSVNTSGYDTETFQDNETVSLRVRAVDKVGNISGWKYSNGITVNTSIGNVGVISDNGGGDNDRDAGDGDRIVQYTWTDLGVDAAGYTVIIFETTQSKSDTYKDLKNVGALADGTNTGVTSVTMTTAAGTTTFQFTGPADGRKYYIWVKAYDLAGNESASWSVGDTISVDITAPNSGGATVSDSGSTSSFTILKFTWSGFTDTGGIDKYEVASCDAVGGTGDCSAGGNWSNPQDAGSNTFVITSGYNDGNDERFDAGESVYLRVRAVDNAGNTSGWVYTDGITVGSGSITDPGQYKNSTSVTFNWNLTDNGIGIDRYEVASCDGVGGTGDCSAGGNWSNPQDVALVTNLDTTGYNDGNDERFNDGETVYLRVRAVDKNSNTSAWYYTDGVEVDTTAPSVGGSTPTVYDIGTARKGEVGWADATDGGSGIDYYIVEITHSNPPVCYFTVKVDANRTSLTELNEYHSGSVVNDGSVVLDGSSPKRVEFVFDVTGATADYVTAIIRVYDKAGNVAQTLMSNEENVW